MKIRKELTEIQKRNSQEFDRQLANYMYDFPFEEGSYKKDFRNLFCALGLLIIVLIFALQFTEGVRIFRTNHSEFYSLVKNEYSLEGTKECTQLTFQDGTSQIYCKKGDVN